MPEVRPAATQPGEESEGQPKKRLKDTLNLPKTEFAMKANLPQREPERLAAWEAMGLYAADSAGARGSAEVHPARWAAVCEWGDPPGACAE